MKKLVLLMTLVLGLMTVSCGSGSKSDDKCTQAIETLDKYDIDGALAIADEAYADVESLTAEQQAKLAMVYGAAYGLKNGATTFDPSAPLLVKFKACYDLAMKSPMEARKAFDSYDKSIAGNLKLMSDAMDTLNE